MVFFYFLLFFGNINVICCKFEYMFFKIEQFLKFKSNFEYFDHFWNCEFMKNWKSKRKDAPTPPGMGLPTA